MNRPEKVQRWIISAEGCKDSTSLQFRLFPPPAFSPYDVPARQMNQQPPQLSTVRRRGNQQDVDGSRRRRIRQFLQVAPIHSLAQFAGAAVHCRSISCSANHYFFRSSGRAEHRKPSTRPIGPLFGGGGRVAHLVLFVIMPPSAINVAPRFAIAVLVFCAIGSPDVPEDVSKSRIFPRDRGRCTTAQRLLRRNLAGLQHDIASADQASSVRYQEAAKQAICRASPL